MFSDYQETLNFLFSQLPMFQNIGKSAFTKDLTNTIKLLDYLGNPHQTSQIKWVHIGGTNGKGSTSSMLASILTANGYKTGLYTSPHLVDFRERIRIDGNMIPESFVIDFTNKISPIIEEINPSFFEMTVALAFEYFKSENIDIGIIEVGLGGRLDSTNVISPILSAITSIGYDHMDILGDTLEAIASEKAGIIKPKVPFLLGQMPETAIQTIKEIGKHNSGIFISNQNTPTEWSEAVSLRGKYQESNLNLVYNICRTLESLKIQLTEDLCVHGISDVQRYSGLRGRWEIIQHGPMVICDTGHNKDGVEMIVQQLSELRTANQELHIVWGMVKDKDVSAILDLLPKDAHYYLCKPNVVRGLDSYLLKEKFDSLQLSNIDCQTVSNAFKMASNNAKTKDIIFVGGSTFVVGNFLELGY
jgi:dihydrofolate synthase/folylpolyglutamate synthase